MSEFEVFDAARRISNPALRLAYLDEACGPNFQLRNQVDELLKMDEAAGSFLNVHETVSKDQASNATPIENLAPYGPHADEISLDFLTPSAKSGSLGKLAHYEVLSVLGRGAFGIVLKAFDESLHRTVAIKILLGELAITSPARKRFLREARSAAAIRHENVVNIYSVEEKPLPFLVMEYIPGQNLQEKLDNTGPLDLPDVLKIGRQIANGLAAAHEMGMVHRDIKPSNILLESGVHERAKISDFGLARAADDASITQSGVIAGTPLYMAPEQALVSPIDQRADLFSLGSVLYVMVSGRPPFRAPTTLAVLKRVTEDTPRPIQEIIPDVPGWLCTLISKLHAKLPADRFQSAKEVADLLGRHWNESQQPARREHSETIPPTGDASTLQAPVRPHSKMTNPPGSIRTTHLRGILTYTFATLGLLLFGELIFKLATQDHEPKKVPSLSANTENVPADKPATTSIMGANAVTPGVTGLPIDFAAERRAAEWVISIGGNVTLHDAQDQPIALVDNELPDENFIVHEVNIFDGKFQDADLLKLRACGKLDSVMFAHTRRLRDSSLVKLEGAQFKHLTLVQCLSLTDNATRSIATIRGLSDLKLKTPQFTDECVAALEPLKQLTKIDFSLSSITDIGLAHLAKVCPQIKIITVSNSLDQRQSIGACAHFANLELAYIDGRQLSEAAISILNDHPALETLYILAPLDDQTILRLKGLKRIRTLAIQCNGDESNAKISEATYSLAIWPECIETLYLSGQGVSPRDQDLVKFAKLPHLRVLGIGGSPRPHLTEAGIEAFRKLRPEVLFGINDKQYYPPTPTNLGPSTPTATSLAVDYTAERIAAEWVISIGGTVALHDAGGHPLSFVDNRLPDAQFSVHDVVIRNDHFDAEDLSKLRACGALESVTFNATRLLTDSALAGMEGTRVKNLFLYDCPSLTSGATRSVATIRGLRSLYLRSPNFTDDCIAALEPLKQLTEINLSPSGITDQGLAQLGKVCPQITTLSIWPTQNSKQSVRAFAHFPNLSTAYIGGDQFSDDVIPTFNSHPALATLYLFPPLNDETILRLKGIKRVVSLFIQSNGNEANAKISEMTYRTTDWPNCVERLFFVGQAVSPRDQDLAVFAKLPNLRMLGLDGVPMPHLTPAAIADFRKLCPEVVFGINGK